jgi:UDP-2,3-diacylglucosamine hydrolase
VLPSQKSIRTSACGPCSRNHISAVPPKAVVIVSDAHLGHVPQATADSFHRFLETVPQTAGHLLINGDLFDFWFEYRRVIPRSAFPTLAALAAVRKAGVELTVVGGNHDRWGGDFWGGELGARFHAEPVVMDLMGFRAFVAHGDGLSESRLASRVMHRVTRLPITVQLFRWIHPDLGFWLADRMSASLAEQTRDAPALDQAAAVQKKFAEQMLSDRKDLDLVILSHTHRAAIITGGNRRWFVNPGAFMDGGAYAVLTESGPVLRNFAGTTATPP